MKSLSLAMFAALVMASPAQQSSSPRQLVEKQMARFVVAMEKRDIDGIKALMTPDFKATGLDGKSVDLNGFIQQAKMLFKATKYIKVADSIQTFKLEGGNAHVVSKNSLYFTVEGQNGKPVKYHNESTTDEIWVPANGTFKIKTDKALTEKRTVDGKPVPNGKG